jgi:OOP family OmpA-OmpF porin
MYRRVAIVLSLAGAIACAGPPEVSPLGAGPVVPGSEERVAVSHVYVLVDSSSSIAEDFQMQKALVRSFVGAMPDGSYEVAAIAFGGYKRQTEGLKPFDRDNLAAGAANLELLKEGTPLDRVIGELTPKTQGKFGRGLVIVFSDGVPTDPVGRDLDPELVISAAKQLKKDWEGDLCFHTVQVSDDPEGAEFMKKLSNATSCGSTRSLSSIQNVAALQNFEREIFFGRRPVVAAAPGDADADGVPDHLDKCPGTPNGVAPDGRGCWVVPGLSFAFDKTDIKDEYRGDLANMVRVLNENPGITVRLDGHTDSVGPEKYIQGLSERRADAVRSYLLGQGIDGDRLTTRGFGETMPAYPNDSEDGRAKNRRTEITAFTE